MHPFTHVHAKIVRATDHFKTLDREIATFLDRSPYELISDFDSEERSYSYRVNTREEVPIIISLLSGEVITHLRSALDHLTWQLALLKSPDPPVGIEFPIFIDAGRYRKERTKKIGALPASAQTIIDELQPYTTSNPTEHVLAVLHNFANIDKHRMLTIVGATPSGIAVNGDGRDITTEMRVGTFDDQTKVGKVTFTNPGDSNLEVKVSVRFELAFAVRPRAYMRSVMPTLKIFGEGVEAIVEKFIGFFAT